MDIIDTLCNLESNETVLFARAAGGVRIRVTKDVLTRDIVFSDRDIRSFGEDMSSIVEDEIDVALTELRSHLN